SRRSRSSRRTRSRSRSSSTAVRTTNRATRRVAAKGANGDVDGGQPMPFRVFPVASRVSWSKGFRDEAGQSMASVIGARPVTARRRVGIKGEHLVGYAFISPLLALFAVYHLYPIVRSFWMSFTDFKYLQPQGTHFVGLANYQEAVQSDYVIHGILLGIR